MNNCPTCGENLYPGLSYCQGCQRPIAHKVQNNSHAAEPRYVSGCKKCGDPFFLGVQDSAKGYFLGPECNCKEPYYYETYDEAWDKLIQVAGKP